MDLLEAGLRRNGAFFQSIGMPPANNSPEWEAFAQAFLGSFQDDFGVPRVPHRGRTDPHPEHRVPGALGVQFFTILADIDHFQCYRARTTGFSRVPVTLSDRFGTRSATVRSAIDLCAPADKNGEDPEAAAAPAS